MRKSVLPSMGKPRLRLAVEEVEEHEALNEEEALNEVEALNEEEEVWCGEVLRDMSRSNDPTSRLRVGVEEWLA